MTCKASSLPSENAAECKAEALRLKRLMIDCKTYLAVQRALGVPCAAERGGKGRLGAPEEGQVALLLAAGYEFMAALCHEDEQAQQVMSPRPP